MKIREFFLLILIIVTGVAFYFIRTSGINFAEISEGNFVSNFITHTFEESLDIEAPLPSSLEVVNSHGGVEVRSADRNGIRLTLIKKVRNRKADRAELAAASLKPLVSLKEGRLRISVDRGALKRISARTDLVLVVPKNINISIENDHGTVNVAGVRAAVIVNRKGRIVVADIEKDLSISGGYGNVDVCRVGAACRIKSRNGRVNAREVAGNLRIDHRFGKVNVEDAGADVLVMGNRSGVSCQRVKGKTDITTHYERLLLSETGPAVITSHHGSVEADDIRGDLSITDAYAKIRVRDIKGALFVKGKSLSVSGISLSGPEVRTDTSFGNVELYNFSGAARIRLSHGNLVLSPVSAKTALDVKNSYSRIRLLVPAGERSPLEARVRRGRIIWNLSQPPALNDQGKGGGVLKAFQADPPVPALLSLATSDGDIVIEETTTPTSF